MENFNKFQVKSRTQSVIRTSRIDSIALWIEFLNIYYVN